MAKGTASNLYWTDPYRQLGKPITYIIIDKDPLVLPTIDNTKFILFAKRIEANESSLKGYYADVTFQNYSNKYVELFAISSDIALSSK